MFSLVDLLGLAITIVVAIMILTMTYNWGYKDGYEARSYESPDAPRKKK